MANEYVWDNNPFQDFLFATLLNNVDISKKEYEANIYAGIITILNNVEGKREYFKHIDYEIKKKGISYKIIGKNIISSLWLSGIFPEDPELVILKNEAIINNIKYSFNKKTNKLTQTILK